MTEDGRNALLDALSVLDDREKYVIGALYLKGDSYRATGKALGVSARTVTRARHSATAKLAAALNNDVQALLMAGTPPVETIPGPSQRMTVAWATCKRCLRQAVPLTDGLCVDVCAPIVAATNLASRA